MAQFFYNFKDGMPAVNSSAGPAPGLSRFLALNTTNYYQEYAKSSLGLDVWQKNPDGVASTFNFSGAYTWGPTGITAANVECLAKLVYLHYNGGGYNNDGPGFYARVSGQPSDNQNYYELQSAGTVTSASSFFRKRVAGTSTDLGSGSGGINKSVPVWYRFQVTGTTLRMRSWNDGTTEPTTWGHTVTDSSISAAGYFAFGALGASGTGYGTSAGTRYRLFQLSFGTDGDAAPSTLTRVVAGTLLKPDGGAANGYLVRCYCRSTGALLGETLANSIGAFSFTVNITDNVYCVGIDQLGNSWNAPVKDLITPSV